MFKSNNKIPPVLSAPLLDVLVLVIPPQTTTTTTTPPTPIPTPPITSTTQPITSLLPATETPDALIPLLQALTAILQRVLTLEKDVKELKKIDHSTIILISIRSQVPHAVNEYLGLSLGDSLQKTKGRTRKDTQPSKKSSASKESSKGNTLPKSSKSGNSVTAEEPDEEHVHDMSLDAEENIVDELDNADKHYDVEASPKNDWFKQPPRPPNPDPEWNKLDRENPKGDRCPFELSKPLPLKGHPGHLTIASEYFFNNDLEYLKSTDLERKYTTSITKTKAARYELVGIEDMIPKKWSVTKVVYDKDAERGIKHWGPKPKIFYISQLNRFSKHDAFSHLKILCVLSVKVEKLNRYGYLEEIMMRRADRQLYKFKEGDFINLHLNEIEDMLLLVVHHKLFHLDGEVIVDLAVALRMFTRSLIIKKRVEDVQLGVESY
ncbi:hypothetical protein Tco_0512579 [Tanacetum coccineum]